MFEIGNFLSVWLIYCCNLANYGTLIASKAKLRKLNINKVQKGGKSCPQYCAIHDLACIALLLWKLGPLHCQDLVWDSYKWINCRSGSGPWNWSKILVSNHLLGQKRAVESANKVMWLVGFQITKLFNIMTDYYYLQIFVLTDLVYFVVI